MVKRKGDYWSERQVRVSKLNDDITLTSAFYETKRRNKSLFAWILKANPPLVSKGTRLDAIQGVVVLKGGQRVSLESLYRLYLTQQKKK